MSATAGRALLMLVVTNCVAATRIAFVGDFGSDGERERQVSALVRSWSELDAVVTLGDNNYPRGSPYSIDENVGKYFSQFMYPYGGKYGFGSSDAVNRFWPCPGNHDYGNRLPGSLDAYLRYMPVRGHHFYDVSIGPVHLFLLDSDRNQDRRNGTSVTSNQAQWLRRRLAASQAPFKIVICHHPPYSSGSHGPSLHMRWPFEEWGATMVLSGHDHTYERIINPGGHTPGFPYFVNGMGGARTYGFKIRPARGSVVRYTGEGGAQLLEADGRHLTIRFITHDNRTEDCYAAWWAPAPTSAAAAQGLSAGDPAGAEAGDRDCGQSRRPRVRPGGSRECPPSEVKSSSRGWWQWLASGGSLLQGTHPVQEQAPAAQVDLWQRPLPGYLRYGNCSDLPRDLSAGARQPRGGRRREMPVFGSPDVLEGSGPASGPLRPRPVRTRRWGSTRGVG